MPRLKLADINPYLTCILCGGYLIDATTIVECLHTCCKACIVRYLETNSRCPICEVQIHRTKSFRSIRPDRTIQTMVYKLVPDLYANEMKRRREFYAANPTDSLTGPEDRGEGCPYLCTKDDLISMSIEYDATLEDTKEDAECSDPRRRYLQCTAGCKLLALQKLIIRKYNVPAKYKVEMSCEKEILSEDYTLMDVVYITRWTKESPLRLKYRFVERKKVKPKLKRPLAEDKEGIDKKENSVLSSPNPAKGICLDSEETNKEATLAAKGVPPTSISEQTSLEEHKYPEEQDSGLGSDENIKSVSPMETEVPEENGVSDVNNCSGTDLQHHAQDLRMIPEVLRRDKLGALDLSTSGRSSSSSKPCAVANPVIVDRTASTTTSTTSTTNGSETPVRKHIPLKPSPAPPTRPLKPPKYHNRFKGSNLMVINPDPNSFRTRIVIKNLDSKPLNKN